MNGTVSLLVLPLLLLAVSPAMADGNEDRLRDALRQSVTQMRAAQDQAAQAQSDLQKVQQDKAALQTQLDAANARAAEGAAKPAAAPEALTRAQADLAASRQQTASLQQALTKYQLAYQGVANQAHGLDEAGRRIQAGLTAETGALETCKTANKRLADVSENILQLYQSQSFRSLLLRSYEPLVGSAKVKLENMIQDYDDKIHDQEYVPGARPK